MLQFFGRRSAFYEPQNSAYFIHGQDLVLLDCPMSTFHRLKEIGPERLMGGPVNRIYVLVTHTHGDHIGGIPMLSHFCYYVLHIPVVIGAPSEEVRKDLEFFIDRLEGCHGYTLEDVSDPATRAGWPFVLDVIPTKHSPELDGRCFGYRLRVNGTEVDPFLPYLTTPGSSAGEPATDASADALSTDPALSGNAELPVLYTEASVFRSPVHLYLEDVLDKLKGMTEQGIRIFLMHLDDEEAVRQLIRGTGIELAPLIDDRHITAPKPEASGGDAFSIKNTPDQSETQEDVAMEKKSEQMLTDIFTVSKKLYEQMSSTDNTDHAGIFTHLTNLGKILAEADRASFWKWDKASHTLWTTAATGTDRITIPDTTGLVGKALSLGKVVITNDPYNDPDFNSAVDKKTGYVTKSILVMPVANIKGEYIGAYQVINKLGGDGKFHEEEDCRKLSLAAVICGLALESDVFLEESHTDKLTKLRNRMGFFADFKRTYDKVIADPERKLSLFICDIDKFKSVNDTYGHNAGDEVLKNVASIMQKNTEATDGIYRWGGEEFIMIMVDADMEKAAAKAESIRKEIEGATCECFGYTIRHTMSFGVTEFDPGNTIEGNISVADEKLYTAKESGRNRVIV